jgi:hypothetical protein
MTAWTLKYLLTGLMIGAMFLVPVQGMAAGDEKAEGKQGVESIYTADEQRQITAWNDRLNYINTRQAEIIKEIGKTEAERGQITSQFAAMKAVAEKRKKAEKKK